MLAIGRMGQLFCAFVFFCAFIAHAFAGSVRDDIEDRGYLRCGIEKASTLFSTNNPLESAAEEYCQALTLALFRNKSAYKIVRIDPGKSENYLQNNTVDLVMLSQSGSRGPEKKTILSAPLFINGFKILSLKGQSDPKVLSGQRICTLTQKENRRGLAILGQKYQVSFSVASFEAPEDLLENSLNYHCAAVALPRVQLLQFKRKVQRLLPRAELIKANSTQPKLGIVVLASDQEWINITSAFGYALLEAEIENITSENIDLIAATSTKQTVQRLLGQRDELAISLGLDRLWAYRMLKSHGNYGEIYQRHFGADSDFPVERDPISLLLSEPVYNQDTLKVN